MTERRRTSLVREEKALHIGPSSVSWDGTSLTIEIDERAAPIPRQVRGRVRLHPRFITDHKVALDPQEQHGWWPIAPGARIEVELDQPSLHWKGRGYFDTNAGHVPLEASFRDWTWSCAGLEQGSAILYEANHKDGGRRHIAIRLDDQGRVEPFEPPPLVALPPTPLWRAPRETRSDGGQAASIHRTLEDTPFYSRSVVDSHLLGQPVRAVHESLSLTRFTAPWVQLLLPFRIPRMLA